MPLYMKWGKGPDIKGEVTETAHKDWIAIDSVSFSAARSMGVQVGAGQEKRHRDLPVISDLQVSRSMDQASPLLFNQSVAGKPTNVYIDFVEPPKGQSKSPNTVASLALRNCVITSYSLGGGGGGASESLSLNFTAINFDYTPFDDKDVQGTVQHGFFDLITAKCTAWK
jgi:type VI secretion system secreted protein Hcp